MADILTNLSGPRSEPLSPSVKGGWKHPLKNPKGRVGKGRADLCQCELISRVMLIAPTLTRTRVHPTWRSLTSSQRAWTVAGVSTHPLSTQGQEASVDSQVGIGYDDFPMKLGLWDCHWSLFLQLYPKEMRGFRNGHSQTSWVPLESPPAALPTWDPELKPQCFRMWPVFWLCLLPLG